MMPKVSLVIAPYATMLALMLDPARATANLRTMAAKGWYGRGTASSSPSITRARHGAPEVVHCFMAHHQGMALLAIDNALLGNRMQERFHHDPLVQSTEFLLEERMPVLVDVTPMPRRRKPLSDGLAVRRVRLFLAAGFLTSLAEVPAGQAR